ncbi:protein DpdH [Sinomonas terrae]|uniref:ATP-binding protein n=1 Tax=Sinomonas terrae TaxID=2908838 RepID=A0ABS9U1Y2_9MICC|nr:protein DpdH [Sinomonas terrae]MCH6470686.1 ATP-binding protein [Sinomonas terrae]
MSDQTGFICWTKKNVLQTIATEAPNPSDSVFVATHAPLDIRRIGAAGREARGEQLVTESELMTDFLERPTNNGVLVVPVLGASGAGKSHLVRWVRANAPKKPGRRIIYLPKGSTSLAGVVEKLLMGLEGAPFDDIRRDVSRLGRDITQESLERRLLDELAESLRTAAWATAQERALVGEQGLYLLLHDPFFRAQLLRDESLIRRRAAHAISGRGNDESDVPLQFTSDDLPSDVLDIGQAAVASQRLFRNIVANDALKLAAIGLLNRHLDVAVMQAANLGVGRLHKAFIAIRQALASEGEEIVLLVEDFALVQGIQRDLLDAVLETSVREGRTVLAPIRTLLAVTTGYYGSLVDTVRTRIESSTPFRYELRVTLGRGAQQSPETEQRVVDFVGRYLNAARVGQTKLDELRATDSRAVANACEGCPVREPCHAGFGTTATGHGLYPYNRPAVLRAVRASALSEEPDAFNPRAVLARVVRHVLTEYADDIAHREFPNERFAEDFPPRRDERVLSPRVSEQATSASEGQRRRVLLEFWGGAPEEFGNIAPEIHTAFGIPAVSGAETVRTTPSRPRSSEGPAEREDTAPADGLKESDRKRLAAIAEWNGRNAVLPADVAREIRRTVRAAVLSRLSWTDPATRPAPSAVIERAWPLNAQTVSIEGAQEAIARSVTPAIRFARTPTNARFFEDLVKMQAGIEEGTLEARLRLDELAERYAPVAQEAALESAHRTDGLLVEALRVSIVGAAARGLVVLSDKPAMLLSASLWNGGDERGDSAIRSPLWVRTEERHTEARRNLIAEIRNALGASQGNGEVQTIDGVRALSLINIAADSWDIDPARPRPGWAGPAAASLSSLAAAVAEQVELLTNLAAEIRLRLPRGTGFAETAKAVQQAIEAGEHHGYVRHDDIPTLKQRNAAATAQAGSRELEVLENDLASLDEDASFERRLAVAARDRGPGIGLMRSFLIENEKWLDAGLNRVESRDADDVGELVSRLAAVTKRWREAATWDGS